MILLSGLARQTQMSNIPEAVTAGRVRFRKRSGGARSTFRQPIRHEGQSRPELIIGNEAPDDLSERDESRSVNQALPGS
jgi:hypothetical protein